MILGALQSERASARPGGPHSCPLLFSPTMAHFFRGSGLGLLPAAATAGAFVARALAKRSAAPALLVLRAGWLPPVKGGARGVARPAAHMRVGRGGGRREGARRGMRCRARAASCRPPRALSTHAHPPTPQTWSTARDPDAPPAAPMLSPFHLAIPVSDLAAARAFYGG